MTDYSKKHAPNYKEVRETIIHLIKDQALIGYNIGIILNDLKLFEVLNKDYFRERVYDTAKLFNSKECEQQQKISDLCALKLNLNFKKKPKQYAVRLFVNMEVHRGKNFNGPLF